MLRSIFITFRSLLVTLLLYMLLPPLLIGVATAHLFGMGSLLMRVFAVTTIEATLITMLVAIPLVWFYYCLWRDINSINAGLQVRDTELSEPPTSIESLFLLRRRPAHRRQNGAR